LLFVSIFLQCKYFRLVQCDDYLCHSFSKKVTCKAADGETHRSDEDIPV
jgi:hypothetical protein